MIGTIALYNDFPQLVVVVQIVPLAHHCAISDVVVSNFEQLTTIEINQTVIAVAHRQQLPLLMARHRITHCLLDSGTRIRVGPRHLQTLTAVQRADGVKSLGHHWERSEGEALIGSCCTGCLLQVCAIGGQASSNIGTFIAMHSHQLIGAIAVGGDLPFLIAAGHIIILLQICAIGCTAAGDFHDLAAVAVDQLVDAITDQ